MFPRWEYSLFQSWFRRTKAFQKPLALLSKIINCFTNIFDRKQLKYSSKVYIFALRRENGNSRRNEPLFLVSVDKLPTCCSSRDPGSGWSRDTPESGCGWVNHCSQFTVNAFWTDRINAIYCIKEKPNRQRYSKTKAINQAIAVCEPLTLCHWSVMRTDSVPRSRFFAEDILKTSTYSSVFQA
jgi:hypothetical protein